MSSICQELETSVKNILNKVLDNHAKHRLEYELRHRIVIEPGVDLDEEQNTGSGKET